MESRPAVISSPALDVSRLPESVLDHRSLVWWGNLLLILIETTMFALLVAAYFYLRPQFSPWPPPQVDGPVPILRPVPALKIPTINLVLLIATLVPMILADRACLRRDARATQRALEIFVVLGLACIALRFREFTALRVRWDDNAYASLVWTTVAMHLLHLIVGLCEFIMMLVWILVKGLDVKHARDVRVTAVYWYWIVGTWIILYSILFIGPRVFP
jgi:cytochrome c oxidase subunit 3